MNLKPQFTLYQSEPKLEWGWGKLKHWDSSVSKQQKVLAKDSGRHTSSIKHKTLAICFSYSDNDKNQVDKEESQY